MTRFGHVSGDAVMFMIMSSLTSLYSSDRVVQTLALSVFLVRSRRVVPFGNLNTCAYEDGAAACEGRAVGGEKVAQGR